MKHFSYPLRPVILGVILSRLLDDIRIGDGHQFRNGREFAAWLGVGMTSLVRQPKTPRRMS
ncbi:hypothetical protein AB9F29_02095 [Falsihalocynthiibacter sp. S25ZX9]